MNSSSTRPRSASRSTASWTGTADVGTYLEQEVPRDPFEEPGIERWRQDDTVPDGEQIRLRALGEFAAVVQEDSFAGPLANRFLHREDVVQEVVGLDARVNAAGMISQHARHHRRDSVPQHRIRDVVVGTRDDDSRGARTGGRVVGQLADAARDKHPNGHLATRVDAPHRLPNPGFEVAVSQRHIERETVGGGAESGEMPVKQERPAVVGAQCLIHPVAVEKSVVEYRDDRLVTIGDEAVHVDCRVHRPPCIPCDDDLRDSRFLVATEYHMRENAPSSCPDSDIRVVRS